jgi:antitoxin (DNA-binding transcriptional repressor) of toxin-antitoxin stability system
VFLVQRQNAVKIMITRLGEPIIRLSAVKKNAKTFAVFSRISCNTTCAMPLSEALESIRGLSFFFKKTQTSNPLDLESKPLDLEVFDI